MDHLRGRKADNLTQNQINSADHIWNINEKSIPISSIVISYAVRFHLKINGIDAAENEINTLKTDPALYTDVFVQIEFKGSDIWSE